MLKEVELLKINLFTHGIRVSQKARLVIEGDERRPLTLADYASTSGISMQLEGNIWVNAPIEDHNPNFVNGTPYTLDHKEGNFVVLGDDLEVRTNVILVPDYHKRTNSQGRLFTNFAITHTDRVRISPIAGCAITCDFCDLPFEFKYRRKTVEELVESVGVALRDPVQPAKHVLISGGTPKKKDYDYLNEVYRAVAQRFPEIDVDVMMVPLPGLLDAQRLRDMGIHGLSINLELNNPEIAREIMPAKKASRDIYFKFIEGAVPIFGEGKVRSLLMVGIEPLEDTLRAVELLAQLGCDPVLSPFRPDPATPMRDHPPPSAQFLTEAYIGAKAIVDKYPHVKLGPRCIPCMHNTLTFPDDSGKYS